MNDGTPVEHLDEACELGEQSDVARALLDELTRSGRRPHDPTRSPEMLELFKQLQTTADLGLTDEQLEAARDAYDRGRDDAVMRMLRRGESQ